MIRLPEPDFYLNYFANEKATAGILGSETVALVFAKGVDVARLLRATYPGELEVGC